MLTTALDITNFVLAGNAILTLESQKTGVHYTYRVQRAKAPDGSPCNRWFVSLLTGPQNTSDYTYIGLLDEYGFRLTAGSKLGADAAPVRGFKFMWTHAHDRNSMPPQMLVRHEGRCGRCSRVLTVPESLDNGNGPECIKHVHH